MVSKIFEGIYQQQQITGARQRKVNCKMAEGGVIESILVTIHSINKSEQENQKIIALGFKILGSLFESHLGVASLFSKVGFYYLQILIGQYLNEFLKIFREAFK